MHLLDSTIGLVQEVESYAQLLNVLEVDDVYGDEGIQVSESVLCGLLAETA